MEDGEQDAHIHAATAKVIERERPIRHLVCTIYSLVAGVKGETAKAPRRQGF